ncbi:diguanylate cyclase [Methylobacterium sp. 092160098-2]|uniref:GGDEF domain-containing response regulator n=1 Tax=Methylobacterium sp. 092160098-2 TaxID=3025129 RepID=UPI002381AEB2|nr:diguanylate cyclase [Methylobacterium sp. 092160098-2]MDE4914127.1 diguanylate cyclase [Methylobacterium sp. 092160098-2]
MHVALVDPSRVVRRSVSEMLVAGGHSVVAFEDSAAALAHVSADPTVDCLLTSLEVHPLNGLELCWSLRAQADERRPLTILVMSASRDTRPLDEVLDSGADDFLAKPPSAQELYGRLRSAERVLKLQTALIRQADTDHLTQLLNRGALMRGARTAIDAASADNPLAVLQIDIDHFKSINDRFGHDVGDLVIRCVSGVLRESAALAGRLGGEEFALLLPGQNLGGAAVLAHRIRSRCAETAVPGQMEDLRFTVSVGLSEWSEGDDIDTLLKRADLALYAAKKAGRNRVAATTTALRTEFVA